MSKVGSRRTGGAGIDTSTTNGFLQFVSGSDPSVRVFASQAQAEAGSDNVTLMTPLRVAQAIAALAETDPLPTSLTTSSSAPTINENAGATDAQGNAFRVGSYWVHTVTTPATNETSFDWYRLEGFLDNGDAVWAPAEQVDTSVITAITSDISDLQTAQATLISRMATTFANVFDSPALITIGSGQRVIELSVVPKDNSTTLASQTSDDKGLFALIEDKDYSLLGNLVFLNAVSGGARSVEDGDIVDLSYVTNMFAPGDVDTPSIGAASGGNATISWTDSEASDDIEIFKCAAADSANVLASWGSVFATGEDVDETKVVTAATGDKFRIRRKTTGGLPGPFSDILTAT